LIILSRLDSALQLIPNHLQKLVLGDCILILKVKASNLLAIDEIAKIFMLVRSLDLSALLNYIADFLGGFVLPLPQFQEMQGFLDLLAF